MPIQQWSDDIILVDLSDEPQLSEELNELEEKLQTNTASHVLLDFGRVRVVNSSNLSQLLRIRKRVQENGKRLTLCRISDTVWSVLLITGLEKLFSFSQDLPTALASLQLGD